MSTYYPDEREESSRLIGELNATINEQAEEIERLQAALEEILRVSTFHDSADAAWTAMEIAARTLKGSTT
jgi:uncharacterized coiled-coil protein SlyX